MGDICDAVTLTGRKTGWVPLGVVWFDGDKAMAKVESCDLHSRPPFISLSNAAQSFATAAWTKEV